MNEFSDKDNRKLNYDKFKSIITDKYVDINEKGVKQRSVQNVLNVIITTNNSNPISIKDNDRRIVLINCNNRYANPRDEDPERAQKEEENTAYFSALAEEIHTHGFYQQLYTFFATRDLSHFNSFHFPRTEARKELIETNKTVYETYVEQNLQEFQGDGVETLEAYVHISESAKQYGFQCCAQNRLYSKLKPLGIEKMKKQVGGERHWRFYFTPEGLKRYQKEFAELSEETIFVDNDFQMSDD
jgi:hypothetical protein